MSDSVGDEMPELKGANDGDIVEYSIVGEILVVMHSFKAQISVDDEE